MIGVFISLDYILINNSGLSKVHKNSFRSFLTSKMLLTSLQAFAVRFKTYKIMCHQNYSECNLLTTDYLLLIGHRCWQHRQKQMTAVASK